MNNDYDDILYGQIREAYGKIVYTYTTHIEKANSLIKFNRWIKNIQILLTAISTVGFLGTIITNETCLNWLAGLTAFISLSVNLYLKDAHLDNLILAHKKTINALWNIREDYLSLLTDFSILDNAQRQAKRNHLQEKVLEIYNNAPETDSSSYKKAQKDLKANEYQFFTADEIDKMLPEKLRLNNLK